MARIVFLPPSIFISAALLVGIVAASAPLAQAQLNPIGLPTRLAQQTLPAFEPLIPRPKSTKGGGRRLFEPPTGQSAPEGTVGGGRRNNGNCPQELDLPKPLNSPRKPRVASDFLTPLLPTNRWGLTVAERPTLLVYVPRTTAKALEFTLVEDQTDEPVYQTTIAAPASAGVVSFNLPTTVAPLVVGKDYRWTVAIACRSMSPAPEDPFTEGLIRRVAIATLPPVTSGKPVTLDDVKTYAQAGIWYDAAAGLVTLRRSTPNNSSLQTTWSDLLEDVGLGALATEPLK